MSMKKRLKEIILFIIIIICICKYYSMHMNNVYASDNKLITSVTTWEALKEAMESTDVSNIEIHLRSSSGEESELWEASSTIIIPEEKTVTLIAESEITIKRAEKFAETGSGRRQF